MYFLFSQWKKIGFICPWTIKEMKTRGRQTNDRGKQDINPETAIVRKLKPRVKKKPPKQDPKKPKKPPTAFFYFL